jgi:hypothetical protein
MQVFRIFGQISIRKSGNIIISRTIVTNKPKHSNTNTVQTVLPQKAKEEAEINTN